MISQKLLNLNLLYQRLRKLHQNVIQRRRERRKKRRLVKGPQLGPSQGQDLDHVLHLILDQGGVIDHGQGLTPLEGDQAQDDGHLQGEGALQGECLPHPDTEEADPL